MEVEIVSEEHIKPSFPTPPHLRSFKLSLLDQLLPVPYAPIVLFYPNHDDHCASHNTIPQRLELLKKSLSETLTRFYPLAGQIKDDLYIECNDEGAYFVEAHLNFCLSEFLRQPDLLLIHKFLPCELVLKESAAGTFVTNIQANVFKCGGIAIGLCISHKIVDGAALSTFIKAWTTTARGSKSNIAAVFPNFDSSSLFPASDDLWLRDSSMAMWGSLFRKGKSVTRRFVFPDSATATLKAQATSSYVKQPSRLEVVSAFIWKHAMAASRQNNGSQKPSLMTHLVNLRRRMTPPLSEHTMGNLLWIAAAARCMDTDEASLEGLVGELRGAISSIDGDFVQKMQGEERNAVMCETLRGIGKLGSQDEADYFGFSSWCKFGFYEADFGWGKPIWVSSIGSSGTVFMNLIILVDTRLGDGIEAWVTLDEPDMARLESNPELLTFASLNPSPLAADHSIGC
ncbi:stemmadenine O-acetyltransferase-like [Juglans microcarpa x Juglans regia]|uniref:stemmadenine O-acetyltransferase-like n=1 Tax=Juglans microcarpa x Juglans regia TaxID=2249226 RepID=UPI001B7F603F|nr:stemmadenine O-acetyltransferase-like [Juglans microcarpa x Juglans regia]